VDVPPEAGIDAIVSHVLEEPGQHILRVEVGYGSADGQKTLRKFYRFQVSVPLIIHASSYKTGESTCFVSLDVQNNRTETKGGITICSADFDPAEGLEAKQVEMATEHSNKFSSAALFDNCGRLEADVTRSYLFEVRATPTSKSGRLDAGDELGTATFTWRKACGEIGRMKSSLLICPNATILPDPGNGRNQKEIRMHFPADSPNTPLIVEQDGQSQKLPVTVEPIDQPSKVQIGKPFHIEFLVLNHSEKYMTLQLQFRMEPLVGVSVCGPSFKNLDEVSGNGGNVRVSVRFIALTAGLLQLRGCHIADLSTGLEVPQPALCNILAVAQT